MLPMHDRTRRALAIWVFLLLGAAPPLVALCVGLSRKLPTHAWAEQRRLTQSLGVDVSLRRAKHLRPRVIAYHDVFCHDPETGEEVLRSPLITATQSWEAYARSPADEAADRDGGDPPEQGETSETWTLAADEVTIRADACDGLTEVVARIFRNRSPWSAGAVRIVIEKVVLESPAPPIPHHLPEAIHAVNGLLRWDEDGVEGQVAFALQPEDGPASPVFVRIARRRGPDGPQTVCRVGASPRAPLPLSLVRLFAPTAGLKPLGDPRFAGALRAEHGRRGWSGQIEGRLLDLKIAYQPPGYPSFGLTASQAALEVRAQIAEGRVLWAEGWFDLHEGWLGRDLAELWQRRLDLWLVAPPGATDNVLPFDRFCLRYRLGDRGLTIEPIQQNGVLMVRPAPQPVLQLTRPPSPVSPVLLIGDMVPHDAECLAGMPSMADFLGHLRQASLREGAPPADGGARR